MFVDICNELELCAIESDLKGFYKLGLQLRRGVNGNHGWNLEFLHCYKKRPLYQAMQDLITRSNDVILEMSSLLSRSVGCLLARDLAANDE